MILRLRSVFLKDERVILRLRSVFLIVMILLRIKYKNDRKMDAEDFCFRKEYAFL